MNTLEEAKDYIRAGAEEGVACPCCGRLVKLYRRKLHAEMALFLIKLYHACKQWPGKAFHTKNLIKSDTKASTDGSYLVRWGLVERGDSENSAGGKAGTYHITQRGKDFVLGRIRAPKYVHILCGDTMGFSAELVTIQDCLGSKFNYQELLEGT